MQSVLNQSQPNQDRADEAIPATSLAHPPRSVAKSTDTPHSLAADDSRDLVNLDLLRTVAVTLVFVDHLAAAADFHGLGDIGRLGVLIFFVHTSLVLMLSMGRLDLSGFSLYSTFLVRRIFRIYPLSILAVLAVVLFRIPAVNGAGGFDWIGWPALFSNIFLTQNLTHSKSIDFLWSLPFEMQMYLVLPFLYLLLSRFPSLKFALWIWLLAIAIASVEWAIQHGNTSMDFLLTRYVPCFLAGVFAWRIMAVPSRRLPGLLWILFLLLLVVAYRAVDAIRVYGPSAFSALRGVVRTDHGIWWPHFLDLARDWIFCATTGVVLPFFREIRINWLNGLSRKVALYSYGIYVAHVPAMWLCFDLLHTGSRLVNAMLSIVLTAAVAILLYHLIEHPMIQFGKRLSTNLISIPVLS
jgi:peptidoglycan/LPS O-acetylase OafA/YrhL